MRPYSSGQQVENLGEYATGAEYKDTPNPTQFAAGTLPRATLPAKWWNWFIGKFTKNTSQTSLAFDDIYGELLDVFSRAAVTPGVSGSVTPQLHSVLMRLTYAASNPADRWITANKNIDASKAWVEKLFVATAGVTVTFPDISAVTDPPYKHAEILNLSSGNITIVMSGSGLGNITLPIGGSVIVFCVRQASGVYTWRHTWNRASAANANTEVIRDSAGRTKMAAPFAADDVAIKQNIDDETTARAGADSALATAVGGKAPIDHAASGTTYGVGSASNYGHVKASAATPLMNGAAATGPDNGLFAREGHVHPTDTSRAAASALTNHENANAAGTHGSTVAATANRLVHRDASGRSQFADPSAAADAATKGYVDTKDNYRAGTELLAGMEVNVPETGATSDTQLTEGFTCKRAGVLRIGFALARYSSGTFYARIYKNGVAVGTERSTTSATWVAQPTEDITVAAGDVITIRGRMSSSSHRGYLGNPYILISDAQHPDKIEMSLCRIINNMPTQVPPMINKQALIVSISTAIPGSGSTISISAPAGGTYSFVVTTGSIGYSCGFVSGGSTIGSGLYEANIITSLLLRRQS